MVMIWKNMGIHLTYEFEILSTSGKMVLSGAVVFTICIINEYYTKVASIVQEHGSIEKRVELEVWEAVVLEEYDLE